jgi:hypothetical protein
MGSITVESEDEEDARVGEFELEGASSVEFERMPGADVGVSFKFVSSDETEERLDMVRLSGGEGGKKDIDFLPSLLACSLRVVACSEVVDFKQVGARVDVCEDVSKSSNETAIERPAGPNPTPKML